MIVESSKGDTYITTKSGFRAKVQILESEKVEISDGSVEK